MFQPNWRRSSGLQIVCYKNYIQYANLRLDVEISSPSALYWYLMYMVETLWLERDENIAHGGMPSG
jgi:hypothetical protein